MADIDIHRPHDFGIERAREGAERMLAELGRRFGLKGRWRDHVLHFEGAGISGALAISATDLHLTITLGFLLKAMRGSIERAVHEELDELFSKAPHPKKPPAKPKRASGHRKKGG
jgi:putative polyhydroxyalkanoate system protein